MTGTYTMRIERGATYRRTFVFKVGETLETAVPRDLTGSTVVLRVFRPTPADGAIQFHEQTGHMTVIDEEGSVEIHFTDEDTASDYFAGFQRAPYRFEISDPAGAIDFPLEGVLRVK